MRAAAVIVILCAAIAGCKKKTEQPSEPKKKDTPLAHKTPVEPRPRAVRPAPVAKQMSPLVSVQWLKQHRSDRNLVILDVSSKKDYDAGHIPGSIHAFVKAVFDEKRNNVILETITDKQKVQDRLRALGLNQDSRIVLVWNGFKPLHTFASAKAYFSLYGFGIRASILDGGVPAWKKAGNPVTTDVPKHSKGNIILKDFDPTLIVKMEEVNKVKMLIDARPPDFFKGKRKIFAPRFGTIPKAVNLPFTRFLDPDLTYRKPEEVRKILADHKVADGAVLFCATGGTAAVAWFAARILAGKKVRLYDGSLNEWAAVKTNPMVMGNLPEKKGK